MHNCYKITCYKTATYALMHFTVAIAVAYALTRNWGMALAIGLVEPVIQTFAFAIHERVWQRRLARNLPSAQAPAPGEPAGHGGVWPQPGHDERSATTGT